MADAPRITRARPPRRKKPAPVKVVVKARSPAEIKRARRIERLRKETGG